MIYLVRYSQERENSRSDDLSEKRRWSGGDQKAPPVVQVTCPCAEFWNDHCSKTLSQKEAS